MDAALTDSVQRSHSLQWTHLDFLLESECAKTQQSLVFAEAFDNFHTNAQDSDSLLHLPSLLTPPTR